MAVDASDAAIVRSTIDLAHNLGLKVVAEGVESEDAWRHLEALGCDFAQGYYLSPPAPGRGRDAADPRARHGPRHRRAAGAARRAGPRALALTPLVGVAARSPATIYIGCPSADIAGVIRPAARSSPCSLPPAHASGSGGALAGPTARSFSATPEVVAPGAKVTFAFRATPGARVRVDLLAPGQAAVRASLGRVGARGVVRRDLDRRRPGRQVHRALAVTGAGTTRYLRVAAERRRAHSARRRPRPPRSRPRPRASSPSRARTASAARARASAPAAPATSTRARTSPPPRARRSSRRAAASCTGSPTRPRAPATTS